MAELYVPALIVIGAVTLLVAWLPRAIKALPLSLPIICLSIGAAVFAALPGVRIDPVAELELTERCAEMIVLIALMGAGLKLDRSFGWRRWRLSWRLIAVAMPLTVGAIMLLGVLGLGLGLASALLLGAALAPTDPVLASDVQVGPPRSGQEDEVRFSLTAEAGMNDAAAFPFLNLAIALGSVLTMGAVDWEEWLLTDVLWKLSAGLVGGLTVGYALGRITFGLPEGVRLSSTGDGFVALGAMLLSYGLTELIHGYGFLAVFASAVTLRAAAPGHQFHDKMHDFMDQLERLVTMLALLLLGGALAGGLLAGLTAAEIGAALLILFVIRPLAGLVSLAGTARPAFERRLIAFFGIRGIGTVYYLAHGMGEASFAAEETVWRVCGLVILLSTILHGVTSTPLLRAFDRTLRADRVSRRRRLRAPGTLEAWLVRRRHQRRSADCG